MGENYSKRQKKRILACPAGATVCHHCCHSGKQHPLPWPASMPGQPCTMTTCMQGGNLHFQSHLCTKPGDQWLILPSWEPSSSSTITRPRCGPASLLSSSCVSQTRLIPTPPAATHTNSRHLTGLGCCRARPGVWVVTRGIILWYSEELSDKCMSASRAERFEHAVDASSWYSGYYGHFPPGEKSFQQGHGQHRHLLASHCTAPCPAGLGGSSRAPGVCWYSSREKQEHEGTLSQCLVWGLWWMM